MPGQFGQPDIKTLEGDVVFYSTLCMQRRKDLYPPTSEKFADPDIFSPERWENWTPRPWQYVPFNGGPRICIGQNFALTEMAFMRKCGNAKAEVHALIVFKWYGSCRSTSGSSIVATGQPSTTRWRLLDALGRASQLPSTRPRNEQKSADAACRMGIMGGGIQDRMRTLNMNSSNTITTGVKVIAKLVHVCKMSFP